MWEPTTMVRGDDLAWNPSRARDQTSIPCWVATPVISLLLCSPYATLPRALTTRYFGWSADMGGNRR